MADNLRKYLSLYSSTCSTFSTGEGVTITPASVTGLPTDTEITLTFDRVDSSGTKTPSKMERIRGTIVGSNFVVSAGGRAVEGTEQVHTSPVVEMIWNADDWNDTVDHILTEHNQDGTHKDTVVITDKAQTLTNKTLTSPLFNGSVDGWISAGETWEYVSVDDPTGIFRVNADVTGKYSAGMRIKMTNGGNVIYGIITVVGSYTGGYTSITFLHQIDPSDNLALVLMANSAITLNYYSTQKAPVGFPLEPTKWQIVIKDTGVRNTDTPTQNDWYNTGTILLTLPIGSWKLGYSGLAGAAGSTVTVLDVQTALSTANNSVSDADFLSYVWWNGASATLEAISLVTKEKEVNVTSKTVFYLIQRTQAAGTTKIFWFGGATGATTTIKANCAYL